MVKGRRGGHIADGICRRSDCGKPFRYHKFTKPKFYCRGCRVKEAREAKEFFASSEYQRQSRIARLARVEGE